MKVNLSKKKDSIYETFGLSKDRMKGLEKIVHEVRCPVHGLKIDRITDEIVEIEKRFKPKNDNEHAYMFFHIGREIGKDRTKKEVLVALETVNALSSLTSILKSTEKKSVKKTKAD